MNPASGAATVPPVDPQPPFDPQRPVLLLVDLQRDFLGAAGLEPPAGEVVERAARLLEAWRARGLPVVHAWTTVRAVREAGPGAATDERMPHWRRAGKHACVAGTPGHATPPALAPRAGEAVVHKRFFSAFAAGALSGDARGALDAALTAHGPRAPLVVAGVHLHGCVRATVLDAYERGHEVVIAIDAVASDDPLHAATTARWLEARAAAMRPVEAIIAGLDGACEGEGHERGTVPAAPRATRYSPAEPLPASISAVTEAAARAHASWRATALDERRALLLRLADRLEGAREPLARLVSLEVRKPIRLARAEVDRAAALARSVAAFRHAPLEGPCGPGARFRRAPLGVVAVVTPWNNPIAIPVGKIAPALLLGNAVVWKPSPQGAAVAREVAALLVRAGAPAGLVGLLEGDAATGRALIADPRVDAVSLTGSPAAGHAALELCGRRGILLHAELGGNNAAIIWHGCDLERAARLTARGAFDFAGQRCTANRRAIVAAPLHDRFVEALARATAALVWGDPQDPATDVGPLVSDRARARVAALLDRARAGGAAVRQPHLEAGRGPAGVPDADRGAYLAPAIVLCDDPAAEVAQEETFGPVLVVQRAAAFEEALALVNGVRQGLAAALFGGAARERARFLEAARAGILKLDQATSDAGVEAPFGGWKASGIGPPEHGAANLEVFTRLQAVYESEPARGDA